MSALPALALWIAMAVMVAIALLLILPRLLSRTAPREISSQAALNAIVYRGQIADLESERASHGMPQADYARAQLNIGRRALDEAQVESPLVVRSNRGVAAAISVVLPVASVALYFVFGDPASVAETVNPARDASAFRARLVDHLGTGSRDGRAWVMLARIDMAGERFADAAASYRKALAASAKIAGDAGVWCELADAIGMSRSGSLEGEPTALIERALAIAPAHPRALEMAGSAAYGRGDFRLAARFWRELVPHVAEDARRELHIAIARAERRAIGSPPSPGPSSLATALR